MYVEASTRHQGQKAQLISPSQPSTAGACLRFWYHMYGSTMGSFHVYLRQGGQITNTIFNMSGNQGNRWIQAELTVKSPLSTWQVSCIAINSPFFYSVKRWASIFNMAFELYWGKQFVFFKL